MPKEGQRVRESGGNESVAGKLLYNGENQFMKLCSSDARITRQSATYRLPTSAAQQALECG